VLSQLCKTMIEERKVVFRTKVVVAEAEENKGGGKCQYPESLNSNQQGKKNEELTTRARKRQYRGTTLPGT